MSNLTVKDKKTGKELGHLFKTKKEIARLESEKAIDHLMSILRKYLIYPFFGFFIFMVASISSLVITGSKPYNEKALYVFIGLAIVGLVLIIVGDLLAIENLFKLIKLSFKSYPIQSSPTDRGYGTPFYIASLELKSQKDARLILGQQLANKVYNVYPMFNLSLTKVKRDTVSPKLYQCWIANDDL